MGIEDLRGFGGGEPIVASERVMQEALALFNRRRVSPALPDDAEPEADLAARALEERFIIEARAAVAPLLENVPSEPSRFLNWFEGLRQTGPGQGDPLFPWLAEQATYEQVRWFLLQEVAGEAGFDDLVALTQLKMPTRAKLEMARNYWDEMGRGAAKGMHGPMLDRLAKHFDVQPTECNVIPEALALGNMMMALASNRRFAFHSVGALGIIELTAPTRAGFVVDALKRLKVSGKHRHYFALHAILDVKHADAWNKEVIYPLVEEDPKRAIAIAEGALLRLWCGFRCFARYRTHFDI